MTAGYLTPSPVFQAFGTNGQFLASGLLYTYSGGTNTPIATYTTSSLTQANANPVVLNALGQATVWLTPGQVYKFNLTDQYGNQLPGYPVDNISVLAPTVLTQQVLGQLLWPQTSAEGLNNVTPTNYVPQLQVDIERYGGAVGASAATNNQAMTNAISVFTSTSGGVLRFGNAGTYTFSGNFSLPQNMFIVGQDSSTVLSFTGTGAFLTVPTGSGRCHIQDCTLVGPTTVGAAPAAGSFAIVLGDTNGNASRFTMERVTINGWDRAMRVGGATWCTFKQVEFGAALGGNNTGNIQIANNYGIDFNFFGSNNYTSAVAFYDCTVSNNGTQGVYATNVSITMNAISFINCNVQNNCVANITNGIQFWIGFCAGFTIQDLYMEYTLGGTPPEAIRVNGLGQGSINGFYISGCTYGFHDAGGGAANAIDIFNGSISGVTTAPVLMVGEHDIVIRNVAFSGAGSVTLSGTGCSYLPLGSGMSSWPVNELGFTPALAVASGSYGGQTVKGLYSQVGNVLSFSLTITWSSSSSPSGQVTITGLPIVVNSTGPAPSFAVGYFTGITPPTQTQLSAVAVAGGTTIILYFSGATAASVSNSAMASAGGIYISGSYQV